MNRWIRYLSHLWPSIYWRLGVDDFLSDDWQRKIFDQHHWLLKQIKALNPESILEVGCGFGRNLAWLIDQGIDPQRLSGVDLSPKLLARAREKLPEVIQLVNANVMNLPFTPNRFELVFTHGLLMHLKPNQVMLGLREIIRVSSKNIILIEEVRVKPQKLNYFTWAHDYEKMIANLPVKIVERKTDKKLWLKCLKLKKLSINI